MSAEWWGPKEPRGTGGGPRGSGADGCPSPGNRCEPGAQDCEVSRPRLARGPLSLWGPRQRHPRVQSSPDEAQLVGEGDLPLRTRGIVFFPRLSSESSCRVTLQL